MKQTYSCQLISKTELTEGIFDFVVDAPVIAKEAVCGQFLHIHCGKGTLLRRPISICDTDPQKGTVRFIFEVKGQGTSDLSRFEIGEFIDIMGPLGHGFTETGFKNPVIIGGGIGVFPLYKLAKTVSEPVVFLGFRSADRVVLEKEFSDVAKSAAVATDDGSYGYHGFAAELLKKHLADKNCDVVYACGPAPMLRAVKSIAEDAGVYCEVSLEQRMGCGIGACLVCACETKHSGTDHYMRVCKNGPVFDSREVTLND